MISFNAYSTDKSFSEGFYSDIFGQEGMKNKGKLKSKLFGMASEKFHDFKVYALRPTTLYWSRQCVLQLVDIFRKHIKESTVDPILLEDLEYMLMHFS